MACDKQFIYIFKGDDTNWNNEQFLTVNITSESVDLSGMSAKFILGNYSETYSLAEGSFKIDLSHAVTSVYSYGPIDGIIQILDSQNRIKTVSNTIPFWVTNKVQDAQDAVYNVEVSPNSPLDIDITLGCGTVSWGEIAGDIQNQTDLKNALDSKVNKTGDTMTGDLNLSEGAKINFPDGSIENENGLIDIMGQQYGLKVDTTSGVGAALLTVRGIGDILTSLDLKNTYSASGTDPVTGQAVAQAISGKQDTLSQTQLNAINSGIDSTKVSQIATNTQAISDETTARVNADNGLQGQIDALSAASDVTDIVGTYAELQAYDTTKLKDNDIIKVLQDSTHDNAPSYYRWSTHTDTFTYIGSESASYTKAQADAKFETQANAAATYATQSALTTGLAGKASSADGTTIVDNGTNISTVAVKEQNNSLSIKEWVGTKAEYDLIEEKDPNTIYTVTDEEDSSFLVVDSALSPTSTNPVQNKVVYDALQNVDSLPSQTGNSGKYLTTDGTNASWATVSSGGLQNTATGTNSLTILGTVASQAGCVNIGSSSRAYNSYHTAIGYNAQTMDTGQCVTIGALSRATGTSSTTIGGNAQATKSYAIAIGVASRATGYQSIAIGSDGAVDHTSATENYSIQLGAGVNNTANLFQVYSYPMLDKTTGKIPAERLDLLSTAYNFSDNNYVYGKSVLDFESASTMEFMAHFLTNSSSPGHGEFLFGSIDVESTGGGFDIAFNSSNQLWISQGCVGISGWAFDGAVATLSRGAEYFFKMVFDGTKYVYTTATDKGFTDVVNTVTFTSTAKIKNSTAAPRIGTNVRSNIFSNYWLGTAYISDFYIKLDGTKVLDFSRGSQYYIHGSPTIVTTLN